MAWIFGDGFDLYATMADPVSGYWDSGAGVVGANILVAGRFTGSQAVAYGATITSLVKSSSQNDAVHHVVCSFNQSPALSGTTLGLYLQLSDVATNQCCIVFRSDGAILLTSATPAGTVLATYTGAVAASNTWFAFEFEVVIHPTAGSFTVRKNGNPSNDFTATSLNTRPGTNSYANKLTVGMQAAVNQQKLDDLLWRSDAASVPWMGDIRCYTRMPASDASAQFSRSITSNTQTTPGGSLASAANGTAHYTQFTAAYSGTIGTITLTFQAAATNNAKCSIFASSGTAPTTVLGSATPVANSAALAATFTFGTPVAVTKGTQYWIGIDVDATSGNYTCTSGTLNLSSTTAYASFPVASPTTIAGVGLVHSIIVTLTVNADMVNETLQDGTTSYVYDSTIGHADFYNIAPLGVTPATVIAVITRGFVEKSDAGFRSGAVQLKSGGATVAAPTLNLATSWLWSWRVDVTDPNTSAAWTPVAVNAVQIGPVVIG